MTKKKETSKEKEDLEDLMDVHDRVRRETARKRLRVEVTTDEKEFAGVRRWFRPHRINYASRRPTDAVAFNPTIRPKEKP